MAAKITTLSPELLAEIRRVIDQVNRQTRNQIKDAPLEVPKAADDYVVLTPATGIPARVGVLITSMPCAIYREVELSPATVGGAKQLVRIEDGYGNAFQLPIYNLFCQPVPGGLFVPTALLKSGTRYVTSWIDCDSSSDPSESSDSSSVSDSSDSSSESDSDSSPSSDSSASSSDSGSSSDEPCPCDGTCLYMAQLVPGGGVGWFLMESTCQSPCYCEPPNYEPSYYEEIGQGACWGPCDSSESSDSESSDSDSSDSDSDQSAGSSDSASSDSESSDSDSDEGGYTCEGYVTYSWQCVGELCVWSVVSYACEPSDGVGICVGQEPQRDGAYQNEIAYGTCVKG